MEPREIVVQVFEKQESYHANIPSDAIIISFLAKKKDEVEAINPSFIRPTSYIKYGVHPARH